MQLLSDNQMLKFVDNPVIGGMYIFDLIGTGKIRHFEIHATPRCSSNVWDGPRHKQPASSSGTINQSHRLVHVAILCDVVYFLHMDVAVSAFGTLSFFQKPNTRDH